MSRLLPVVWAIGTLSLMTTVLHRRFLHIASRHGDDLFVYRWIEAVLTAMQAEAWAPIIAAAVTVILPFSAIRSARLRRAYRPEAWSLAGALALGAIASLPMLVAMTLLLTTIVIIVTACIAIVTFVVVIVIRVVDALE